MNVKRVALVSLITFFIGAAGGGIFAFVNHPANGGSETGSKYTGITYNGENNSVVIATPQKEQGNLPVETVPSNEEVSNETTMPFGTETQNAAPQTSVSKGRVAIQEGSLNVRGQASTDGTILGQVYKGDTVEILSQNGAWYQIVTSGGVKGYVSATYIEVLQ